MATSLARQLAALRTPASLQAVQDTAYSGPFLFPEANQDNCDFATLKENAASGLTKLIEMDISFTRFIQFIQEESLGDQLESELVEDLLFLLSPFTLVKPAQWVLQFLVTKHKAHYKYPEVFFFCVLPFYEYDICSKALSSIDTAQGGNKYPNWLPNFRKACTPTNKNGLWQHTARDRGFLKLLCDMMLRLIKQTVKFPDLRLQRQTSFFLMNLLGALGIRASIEDVQVNYILQVVLHSIKSNNQELVSMAQILLSSVLPRASFKEKVVNKITKSLKKCINKAPSLENLLLCMMIIRTQGNLDKTKAIKLIFSLEAAINNALNNAKDQQESNETLDSLLYSLAVLAEPLVPRGLDVFAGNNADHLNGLLSLVLDILKKAMVSAESLGMMGGLTYSLLKAIARTKDDDIVDQGSVDATRNLVNKIMKQINKVYPAEYQKIVEDTDDVDLFFLTGNEPTARPSEVLVSAKKAILNNKLVDYLLKNTVRPKEIASKGLNKLLTKNAADIKSVLAADTGFLMEQLEAGQLERLLTNLVAFGPTSNYSMPAVIGHLCSQRLADSLASHRGRVELLLLPFYYAKDQATRDTLVSSHFAQQSALLASLEAVVANSSDKLKRVVGKLASHLTSAGLTDLLADPLVMDNQRSAALLMLALSARLDTDAALPVDRKLLIRFIVGVVDQSVETGKQAAMSPEKSKKKKVDKEAETDKVLTEATESALLIKLLHRVEIFSEFSCGLQLMESLPRLVERKMMSFVEGVGDLAKQSYTSHSDLVKFYLQVANISPDLKARYFALQQIGKLLNTPQICKQLVDPDPKNDILVLLLVQALAENKKIQKVSFGLVKPLASGLKETSQMKPLLDFFANNRSELLAEQKNIGAMLARAASGVNHDILLALLRQTVTSPNALACFNDLVDMFKILDSKEAILVIADFGRNALRDEAGGKTVAAIVTSFYKKLVKQADEETCLAFLLDCIKCDKMVTIKGLQHKISELTLEKCSKPGLWASASSSLVASLVTSLLQLNGSTARIKMAAFLATLNLPVHIFESELQKVCMDKPGLRARRRRQEDDDVDMMEDEETMARSAQTLFLVELLEGCLPRTQVDAGWQVLFKPLFNIFRSMPEKELVESSYKLTMVLTVIDRLFLIVPDNKIKALNKQDVEPELLTLCIRRCLDLGTRELSLKVLGQCAKVVPDYVLQNSLSIFTFMGDHLLRMDTKHSYKIACDSVDVIVPAMKASSNNKNELQKVSLEILNSFINMEADVPEHRYSEFIFRLVKSLGTESYLWVVLLASVKSTFKAKQRHNKTILVHRRLTELLERFPIEDSVGGLVGLLVNLRSDLPQIRRMFACTTDRKRDESVTDDWDVLRMGALAMLNKVIPSIKETVGSEINKDEEKVRDVIYMLLEAAMNTLEAFEKVTYFSSKFKEDILAQTERMLENVLGLLSYRAYISIVKVLLGSPNPALRRRSMQVISGKLEESEVNVAADVSVLLPSLLELATKETVVQNKQMALLAIGKISSKIKDSSEVRVGLETLDSAFLATITNPVVLGAAVLTMTGLLSASGVVGVPYVEKIVNWLLDHLDNLETRDWDEKNKKAVYSSILFGLQRVMGQFGGFINPFLQRLVVAACRLYSHPLAGPRAKSLLESMSVNVSPHVLLARCNDFIEPVWDDPVALTQLAGLIKMSTSQLERGQVTTVSKQIVGFYAQALAYRAKMKHDKVEETESEIIETFLAVILRLSLDNFKPIFHQIVNKQKVENTASLTTLYNFKTRIASCLKNLFGFAVEGILVDSIDAIKKCTPNAQNGDHSGSQNGADAVKMEANLSTLLTSVLKCLSMVMKYNDSSSLSMDDFKDLSETILAIQPESEEMSQLVEDAIVGLADSSEDDLCWKHLNYAVLTETRSPSKSVRLRMVNIVRRFVSSKHDSYMVVLPDAVPFIIELMESDEQDAARDLVKHMETVFEQNLDSYFY